MTTGTDREVCVLGLGYVGLTLAVAMADAGFRVQGVEIRGDVVDMLERDIAHFHEPGLESRLARVRQSGHLAVSKTIPENYSGTVFIITVGTPLGPDGRSRLDMVENVASEVSRHLKDGDFVIMRSTVKLGTTRKVVVPILQSSGKDYDLAFCPERTLEGKALTELRRLPQIVGGETEAASMRASRLFQHLTPTVVRVSDIETAEMIKLIDNTSRDVAFAFANEVARACDAVGISAAEVIQAGKLGYPRTNLPMPGPVGGPCLEKDPHILAEGLAERGLTPAITKAARQINEDQPGEVVTFLKGFTSALDGFSSEPVITLLGIAFKGQPATDDLRGTMAQPVFDALRTAYPGARFRGYDAVVANEEIARFGLEPAETLEEAVRGASLALILNNHPVFTGTDPEALVQGMARPAVLYDFWNTYYEQRFHLPEGTRYVALGSHGKPAHSGDKPALSAT